LKKEKKRKERITWICEPVEQMASQRYSIICLCFLKLEPVHFR
jgi:hypothetical protein